MRRRLLPTIAFLLALSLVAACGQKSGVHLATGGGGDVLDGGGEGEAALGETTESGEVVIGYDAEGNAITAPAGSAAANAATGVGRTSTRRNVAGPGATTTTTSGSGTVPTTKAWGKTITIGIHAPITGAAPLPSSFQAAAKFVKDYYNSKGGIHGRSLEIVIVDDQYQPAIATQRCQEMVKQNNAFLLIGAAGTDQIQACARYAASAGVPYLSAGVTEKGLTRLKNYFALSMSYRAQGPYLANFMRQKFPDLTTNPKEVAMVYSDTPNFGDAVKGFTDAFPGVRLVKLPRVPNGGDLGNAARDMCTAADGTPVVKIAYPLMAPKDWLTLMGQQTADCRIQWSGIGVTMGVNEVAKNGCNLVRRQFEGSTFFTPFAGEDVAEQMDPEFAQALGGRQGWDDIWIALWGTTKGVVKLLDATGEDLTRRKFVTTTENTTNLTTGINPALSFSPSNHFGADKVHVFQADCEKRKYNTIETNKQY